MCLDGVGVAACAHGSARWTLWRVLNMQLTCRQTGCSN
jgi:hypothetical protein